MSNVINGLEYRLESQNSNSDENSLECEWVYYIKHPDISNNEEFAKLVITCNSLNIKSENININSFYRIRWYTIRDENGDLLQNENLTWSYSDVLRTQKKLFNTDKFKELAMELSEMALEKRLELRKSWQLKIADFSQKLTAVGN